MKITHGINFCLFFNSLFWHNVVRQDLSHFDSVMNPIYYELISVTWAIAWCQTMKFDQLIDYNVRNIFLEKSYTKCDGETSPGPFSEKIKLSISSDQESKVSYSLFYYMLSRRLSKYIETALQTTCI